jgi:hypothetical protein
MAPSSRVYEQNDTTSFTAHFFERKDPRTRAKTDTILIFNLKNATKYPFLETL